MYIWERPTFGFLTVQNKNDIDLSHKFPDNPVVIKKNSDCPAVPDSLSSPSPHEIGSVSKRRLVCYMSTGWSGQPPADGVLGGFVKSDHS